MARYGFPAALLIASATFARAVILFSTADPSANTTAPGGALAGSGWQYEGTFGSFLGTPIGPHDFITVQHIGFQSSTFNYQGANYSIVRAFDDPQSDLRIFEVAETFPSYAPLYTTTNELGQMCVVIGRGTQRGNSIVFNNAQIGWSWGASDGIQRWGQNIVASIQQNFLYATFDQNGIPNEAHLSAGDSGGGVFLNENGVWKLAGINYAVDGPYHFSPGDNGFLGALFDTRGLYDDDGNFISGTAPVPSGFYAIRISDRLNWIRSIIDQELVAVSPRAVVFGARVSVSFVVTGESSLSKRVLVRGLGPSLSVSGRLADPVIQLFNSSGEVVASNDNWKTGSKSMVDAVKSSGFAPTNSKESAFIANLSPGSYTAVLSGAKKSSGIGVLDVRDLDSGENLLMGNVAARASVGTGDGVLVSALSIQSSTKRLLLRAVGPDLGVAGALSDPLIELYDANGNLVASNDNWRNAANSSDIQNTGLAPGDDRDAAILITPNAGNYSVTVRGSNGGTGVCQLEAYLLP